MVRIVTVIRFEHDRKTLMTLLSPEKDFDVLHAGTDGCDALISASDLKPDIVIMEQRLPDINGTELAPLIKRRSPATALILILPPDEKTGGTLQPEISGYLLKYIDRDELASSIRSVFYGGFYISAQMLKRIFSQPLDLSRHAGYWRLLLPSKYREHAKLVEFTATELQIIAGIAYGCSDKETAGNLHLMPGSVRNCICGIKHRTGLRTRTQMVLYALMHGLIKIEPDFSLKSALP